MTRAQTWSEAARGAAVRGRTVRGAVVAVAAAASVSLVAACGSGDSSAAPAPSATALVPTTSVAPAATVTDTPPAETVTATPPTRTVTATPTRVPTGGAPGTATPTSDPGTPSAGTSSGGSSGSGPAAPCRTADLRVSLGGGSGGAAGSVYTGVEFVNTGSSACTLDGHPGVSYVAGSDGHQVGAAAERSGTPSRVVLAPGALASASLQIVQYASYPTTRCKPVAVRGFRVYPPDQTAAAFVPSSGTACSATSTPLLTVGPVQAGRTTR